MIEGFSLVERHNKNLLTTATTHITVNKIRIEDGFFSQSTNIFLRSIKFRVLISLL